MPLVDCPVCGRGISSEAAACPQCGHPNRSPTDSAPPSTSPQCYACTATATTRCQACGALSCVQHVRSIYVSRGKGGSHELRCEKCDEAAVDWNRDGCIIQALVVAFIVAFILGMIFLNIARR